MYCAKDLPVTKSILRHLQLGGTLSSKRGGRLPTYSDCHGLVWFQGCSGLHPNHWNKAIPPKAQLSAPEPLNENYKMGTDKEERATATVLLLMIFYNRVTKLGILSLKIST
ncbi:hypothetical protein VTN77DRAFT_4801 [Rasamsonia byssochlamydoides]|uniref:uncharacterized protein n=1 Tax=Rasamsonia byssochlamydoides TaxID=89139 RepID=UPI0037447B0C